MKTIFSYERRGLFRTGHLSTQASASDACHILQNYLCLWLLKEKFKKNDDVEEIVIIEEKIQEMKKLLIFYQGHCFVLKMFIIFN